MAHTKLGEEVLNRMAESISEIGIVEKDPEWKAET